MMLDNAIPKPAYFFVFIIICFLLLRFLHLEESIGFGSDAGRDFLVARSIYIDKKLTLIGPPSQFTVNGRQFYFGPAPYYLILPSLIAGNWEPLSVSFFMIFMNLVVLIVSWILLDKNFKNKLILYLFVVFYTFTPVLIEYSRTYWNPYLMLPISLFLLPLLFIAEQKHTRSLLFLGIGFLFGLGLQMHYSFILAIIACFSWLFLQKILSLKKVIYIELGFILGFFPIIIFELRNHFYNTKTLLLILENFGKNNSGFAFPTYYYVSLLPFVLLGISWVFSRLKPKQCKLFNLLVFLFILWSLIVIIPVPKNGFGMVNGWNYVGLKKTAKFIWNNSSRNFNIADQLTGDTRALALRYLLTVHGTVPEDVTQYPLARNLYVYSRLDTTTIMKDTTWEISSAKPFDKIYSWPLQNAITLYKLEK